MECLNVAGSNPVSRSTFGGSSATSRSPVVTAKGLSIPRRVFARVRALGPVACVALARVQVHHWRIGNVAVGCAAVGASIAVCLAAIWRGAATAARERGPTA